MLAVESPFVLYLTTFQHFFFINSTETLTQKMLTISAYVLCKDIDYYTIISRHFSCLHELIIIKKDTKAQFPTSTNVYNQILWQISIFIQQISSDDKELPFRTMCCCVWVLKKISYCLSNLKKKMQVYVCKSVVLHLLSSKVHKFWSAWVLWQNVFLKWIDWYFLCVQGFFPPKILFKTELYQ